MMKKYLVIITLILTVLCSAYKRPEKYTINAEKNAFYHNNVGVNYLKDRIYYAAIQEFKIAISLSPNSQAAAIFYNNLGETYDYIGYPDMSRDCFEKAIDLYGLNFKYYINLIECYKKLGIIQSKINEYSVSKNPMDKIKLGLAYAAAGKTRMGIITLDEFTAEEPDLMITPAVRQYLKELTEQIRND